ncbi:hypothetical protein [Bacteroides sp.]
MGDCWVWFALCFGILMLSTWRLERLHRSNEEIYPTTLLHFIYSYQYFLHQQYDVFLSHNSLDTKEIFEIKAALNMQGLIVYIDWGNDSVKLDRKNQNENTWNVLEMRMKHYMG